MSETLFKEILGEFVKRNYAEFDNAPEHKFSLKHRLTMKRIFARYERNMQKLKEKTSDPVALIEQNKPRLNFKQRMLIVICIIVLMTFLVGWVIVFVSENFHGTVHKDSTQLIAINLENCPPIIEYRYVLASVPDGFELIETNISPTNTYTLYMNNITRQTITLQQWVKSHYTPHLNTEHQALEEVNIYNIMGLCVDLGNEHYDKTIIVWDNGDYIIEILADLDKDSIIDLSKINKIK